MKYLASALVLTLAAQANAEVLHDLPYGADRRQRFDVYLPAHPEHAPVIFMVHGGGWRIGSKSESAVVSNKAPYFTGRGYVFVSVDYRMLPDADPLQQARDVAQALAAAQDKAASWGADRKRFILMGHSAGAHLVALLNANPLLAPNATPWLGTVSLDSGALDVVDIMGHRHLRLYDEAFGRDAVFWRSVSPYWNLQPGAKPILLVCSTRRDDSCSQADAYLHKLSSNGVHASVLRKDMSHREINLELGADATYTQQVQDFLNALTATAGSPPRE